VLRKWQGEALAEYPTARIRKDAVHLCNNEKMLMAMQMSKLGPFGSSGGPLEVPAVCANEESFYEACGVLPLTSEQHKVYRTELRKCFEQYCSGTANKKKEAAEKAGRIADEIWATNATYVDLEWQRNKPNEEFEIDVAENPFNFALEMVDIGLRPPKAKGLFDYVSFW